MFLLREEFSTRCRFEVNCYCFGATMVITVSTRPTKVVGFRRWTFFPHKKQRKSITRNPTTRIKQHKKALSPTKKLNTRKTMRLNFAHGTVHCALKFSIHRLFSHESSNKHFNVAFFPLCLICCRVSSIFPLLSDGKWCGKCGDV